jgi:hypothetical protein
MEGPDAPYTFIPKPQGHRRTGPPETISGWKALADGFLTSRCCAFHRNVEISSRYVWMYELSPACFKWAAMAAIASHHVRLALYPLRLDTDRAGHPGSLSTPRDVGNSLVRRRAALIDDINTIRSTNNAIFDDIFWVHLAYLSADDGIERLRTLLRVERHYAPVLAGFETIDHGRRMLQDRTAPASARRMAEDLIWDGNVQLLEHEQRALVQPNFDRLSGAFGRLISFGSATTFEVHGARQNAAYFSSFYLSSLRHVVRDGRRGRSWPRITRFEDRWRWLSMSIVPRFRRFDADSPLIQASLRRIADEAGVQALNPCVLPRVRRSPDDDPRAHGHRSAESTATA